MLKSMAIFALKFICITRMSTFIKGKLKKSYDMANIYKYRVAANITNIIFYQIIIPKFM